jgi:dCMP deaminase
MMRCDLKLRALEKNALAWAEMSTCDRLHAGAVIFTPDYQQISQGYNGSLPGLEHCDEAGHLLLEGHCVRTIHAEDNALAWAKKLMGNISGCYMLATHTPCLLCTKQLIRDGIVRVYYLSPYGREEELRIARELMMQKNVELIGLR